MFFIPVSVIREINDKAVAETLMKCETEDKNREEREFQILQVKCGHEVAVRSLSNKLEKSI